VTISASGLPLCNEVRIAHLKSADAVRDKMNSAASTSLAIEFLILLFFQEAPYRRLRIFDSNRRISRYSHTSVTIRPNAPYHSI
jgi:hypothetical protein